jgi:hypothetical protein
MSSSNGYATREQFFEQPERRFKDVSVAGMKYRIRSLTEGEWSAHQIGSMDLTNGGNSAEGLKSSDARLIVACVVDANGAPIFRDTDVARLAYSDAGMTEPLVRAIRQHCRVIGVEDSVKNCDSTGGDGSPTSSCEPQPPVPATA